MAKTVGILGGMGPEATSDLFKKIIDLTPASKDQEHIHILVDDNVEIPDRTSYILGEGVSPLNELMETGMKLKLAGADIIVMPCNTAHYFYDELIKFIDVDFINMIDEVGKYIYKNYKEREVGLLATKGTYKGNVYEKYLREYGIKVINPSDANQNLVLKLIYDYKTGVRNFDENVVKKILDEFKCNGIKNIILGCTELPLIFNDLHSEELKNFNFISSTDVLAQSAVDKAEEN